MIDETKLIDELKQSGMIADNEYGNAMLDMINGQPKIGGWIPCSERLPETSEYMEFEPTPHMKRIEISYMTDTVEYLIGFYDGSKWMDKHHNTIKNVIAWKPFLKLPEAYHG